MPRRFNGGGSRTPVRTSRSVRRPRSRLPRPPLLVHDGSQNLFAQLFPQKIPNRLLALGIRAILGTRSAARSGIVLAAVQRRSECQYSPRMPSASVPCVIYAAKSSQDEHDALADQVKSCQAAIEREGGRHVLGDPYAEDSASGFTSERGPQLEAAMRAATAAAGADVRVELWVWHSSRLARGSGHAGQRSLSKIHADLLYAGVQIRSVEDDAFVTNPMLVGIASGQNHKYSEDLSTWVQAGKEREFKKGNRTGGPLPDGLLKRGHSDTGDLHYVRDPERAPIIEEAFKLALENYGDAAIARRLNAQGYRTRNGNPYYRRAIQDMVTNPTYCGRVFRRKGRRKGSSVADVELVFVPDDVETNIKDRLVSREDFDTVQALRASRDKSKPGRKSNSELGKKGGRPTTRYVLSGLAICSACGERMYAQTSPYKRKDGSQARAYLCKNVKFATGLCAAPKVDAVTLDTIICEHLAALFANYDEWFKSQATGSAAELARLDSLADNLDQQVKDLERKIESGTAMLANHFGSDEADTLLATLTALRSQLPPLQAERDEHLNRASALRAVDAASDGLAAQRQRLAEVVTDAEGSSLIQDVNVELRRAVSGAVVETLANGRVRAIMKFADLNRANDSSPSQGRMIDGRVRLDAEVLDHDPLDIRFGNAQLPPLSSEAEERLTSDHLATWGVDLNDPAYWERVNADLLTFVPLPGGAAVEVPAS